MKGRARRAASINHFHVSLLSNRRHDDSATANFPQGYRMTVLVTGAAGFIGYHVTEALLARGEQVIGIDNLNDYYDVRLK